MNIEKELVSTKPVIRVIEFFSGIGGWASALNVVRNNSILSSSIPLEFSIIEAFDINPISNEVYLHNYGHKPCTKSLEGISAKDLDKFQADCWVMSPPCQPYTRTREQDSKRDQEDPRAKAFLRLITLLNGDELKILPRYIALENVIGFENSICCQEFLQALAKKNYSYLEFNLTPTQFGVPNERPRYFCIAIRNGYFNSRDFNLDLNNIDMEIKKRKIDTDDIRINNKFENRILLNNLYGENEIEINKTMIRDYIDVMTSDLQTSLLVPTSILEKSVSWCLDIVLPQDITTSCFTKSYSVYIKGTGSVLLEGKEKEVDTCNDKYISSNFNIVSKSNYIETVFREDPSTREFDSEWKKKLGNGKLRYFSPVELSRIFGFLPSLGTNYSKSSSLICSRLSKSSSNQYSFNFPTTISNRKCYELLGNSINVVVVSNLLKYLFNESFYNEE